MIDIKPLVGRQKAFSAKMPLANTGGHVAVRLERLRKRQLPERQLLVDDWMPQLLRRCVGAPGQVSGEMQPCRRSARKNGSTGRRTNRLGTIGRREAHAVARELIEIGRIMFFASVTREIVDAKIIRENEHDVRGSGNRTL